MILYFHIVSIKLLLFIQIKRFIIAVINHMLQRRTADFQLQIVITFLIAVFCQIADLKNNPERTFRKLPNTSICNIVQLAYIYRFVNIRFYIRQIHHNTVWLGKRKYIRAKRAVRGNGNVVHIIPAPYGNLLHRYLIKRNKQLCPVTALRDFIVFFRRQVKHYPHIRYAVLVVRRGAYCRNDTAVRGSDFLRQPAFRVVKIQYDFLIIYIRFFPSGYRTICLYCKYLPCIFPRRHRNLIQRNCRTRRRCRHIRRIRYCRIFRFSGLLRRFPCRSNGNRTGRVIPCNFQLQSLRQRAHRQHRPVIDHRCRYVHCKFLAVLVADFAVHAKNNRVIIIDYIRLSGLLIPCYLTAQFLRDQTHGQHSAFLNNNCRHILRHKFLAVNLNPDFFRLVRVIFSVIKQIHADRLCIRRSRAKQP